MKLIITHDDGDDILGVSTNDAYYDYNGNARGNLRYVILTAIDMLIESDYIWPEDILVSISPHLKKRITRRNRVDKKYSRNNMVEKLGHKTEQETEQEIC